MTKMSLLDSLVRSTVLYDSIVWWPSLLESYWASVERVQTLMFWCIIRSHWSTPYSIIFIEFGAHLLGLVTIFDLV